MGFWKEVREGFATGRTKVKENRALVPVSSGEIVPTTKGGALIERQSPTPALRHARDLQAAPDAEVIEYDDAEIVASAPLFRFEVWCSKTGRPFIAVAERHGETLWIIGNEKPDGKTAPSGWPTGYQHYAIDAAPEWRCPWCGVREDAKHDFLRLIWACGDPACGEPLHCCGSRRDVFLCACGQRARRAFQRADVFKVYEYDGLRGPAGRGELCGCPRPDGGVEFALYRGASTGSLVR
jgi:hypothetical protein